MKEIVVTVNDPAGLHARPAADLMKLSKTLKCKVEIQYEDQVANAKSLLEILSLGINQGDQVKVICDGENEQEAIACFTRFFND